MAVTQCVQFCVAVAAEVIDCRHDNRVVHVMTSPVNNVIKLGRPKFNDYYFYKVSEKKEATLLFDTTLPSA